MRAEIIRGEQGFIATFDRRLAYEPEKVWAMLTDNAKLQQWFSELTIESPGEKGVIKFDMGDGSFEEMPITDYEKEKLLAFEWGQDHVRFELLSSSNGTLLRLTETISKITAQTPKDLAGWHVCLDTIETILDGNKIERGAEWAKWLPEYKRLLDSMTVEFE